MDNIQVGEMLVSAGIMTEEKLNEICGMLTDESGELVDILIEKGYIGGAQLSSVLEKKLGIRYIDLSKARIPSGITELITRDTAIRFGIVPVSADQTSVRIAASDPFDFVMANEISAITKRKAEILYAPAKAIKRAAETLYGSENAEKALRELRRENEEFRTARNGREEIIAEDDESAPTIRLVNSFIEYAVKSGASDIHLEPGENGMTVRMRIDGRLRKVFSVPDGTQNPVIARVKVMGGMDISEHRVPLDGRCDVKSCGREIDLRISTIPTVFGEKAVIRLLDKSADFLTAEGLGLRGNNLKKYTDLLKNTGGVILITGPTGSGKSSTMSTMIRKLNTEEVNIVTLEDPVEYNIRGVSQIQISEKTGMTFAGGLRSVLRQDPDIISVGEIRDPETAQIAMRAAMTGHLVLSTVHTNDAVSTITRLRDIGIEDYMIASALKGVISQRLVRKICPHCGGEYEPDDEEQKRLGLEPVRGRTFLRGKGCPECSNTGYSGRTAVFEIFIVNTKLKKAISDGADEDRITAIAEEDGFEHLMTDCARLVCDGTTSPEEVFRILY